VIPMPTVQTETGYKLRFDYDSEGVYPDAYYLHGLWMPSDRVPANELDELHQMAFSVWHQRGAGDIPDEDVFTYDDDPKESEHE
jgi:hypothetical protein